MPDQLQNKNYRRAAPSRTGSWPRAEPELQRKLLLAASSRLAPGRPPV